MSLDHNLTPLNPNLRPLLQAFFIVALLAASVASQAMISGAFQIIKQSVALGCFPRVTIKNLSPNVSDTPLSQCPGS